MHDHFLSPPASILQESVTYNGVTGLGVDGRPPESLIDECLNALARIREILAANGLTPDNITHLVCMITDSVVFASCQRMVAEALGSAQLTMTLRLKSVFDVPGQRLEFNLVAVA